MSAETARKSGQTVGVRCPSCAAALKIARTLMGRKLRCPLCGQAFRPRVQNDATVAVPTMMGDLGDFPPPVAPLSVAPPSAAPPPAAPLSVSNVPHSRSDTVEGTAVVSPSHSRQDDPTRSNSRGFAARAAGAVAPAPPAPFASPAPSADDATDISSSGQAASGQAASGQAASGQAASGQAAAAAPASPASAPTPPATASSAPAKPAGSETNKPDPLLGQQVKHFLVRHVLGRGAMGTVYEAEDTVLRRKIALKVLAPKLLARNNKAALERFLIEARAAAALSHPNIVYIHEIGVDEKEYAFIAMELVRGGSAADYIDEHGPMSPADATRVITESAKALGEAHFNGVVHRDVKPDNIMIGPDWLVKVTDFGLAKRVDEIEDVGTKGKALGTPGYMSPETCRGLDTDARSDLYSLGATYYCLLVGKPPFRGDNVRLILRRHLTEPGPDPRLERPEIPAECAAVIRRSMDLDPLKRYQSAREMIADLQAIRFDLPADGAGSHEMQDWAEQAAEAQDAVSVASSQEDLDILAMAIPERKGFGSGNPLSGSGNRTIATTQIRLLGGSRHAQTPGSSRLPVGGAGADLSELAAAAEALSKSAPMPSARVGSSTSGLNRIPANLKSSSGSTRAIQPGKSGEISRAAIAAGVGEARAIPGMLGHVPGSLPSHVPGSLPGNGGAHHPHGPLVAAMPTPEALLESDDAPVTGAMHTGAMHTGAMHTGAMHTGAMHTGAMHTGAMHTGAMHTGAMHTGAMHTGAMHTGAMPTGAMHPGAMPTGGMHTGAMHTGAMPAGPLSARPHFVGGGSKPIGSPTPGAAPASHAAGAAHQLAGHGASLAPAQVRPMARPAPMTLGRGQATGGVPIAVVLVGAVLLLVVIGLLVWRPWAEEPPAPTPMKKPTDEIMVNPDPGPAGASSKANPTGSPSMMGPLALGPTSSSTPNSSTPSSSSTPPSSKTAVKTIDPVKPSGSPTGTPSTTTPPDAVPPLESVPTLPADPAKIEAIGRELAELTQRGNQAIQEKNNAVAIEVIEQLEALARQHSGSQQPVFANFGRNAASEAIRLRRYAGAVIAEQDGVLVLFEDRVNEFAQQLTVRSNRSVVAEDALTAFAGSVSLRVTPEQAYNPTISAWSFPIEPHPKKGEYRYIRFAWKKQGGQSITIQLAHNGLWGSPKVKSSRRYSAGPQMPHASLKIAEELPTDWVVVTRDLASDFGQFTLTGIALTPHDGDAGYFDHIVLARSIQDLDRYTNKVRRK